MDAIGTKTLQNLESLPTPTLNKSINNSFNTANIVPSTTNPTNYHQRAQTKKIITLPTAKNPTNSKFIFHGVKGKEVSFLQ